MTSIIGTMLSSNSSSDSSGKYMVEGGMGGRGGGGMGGRGGGSRGENGIRYWVSGIRYWGRNSNLFQSRLDGAPAEPNMPRILDAVETNCAMYSGLGFWLISNLENPTPDTRYLLPLKPAYPLLAYPLTLQKLLL